MNLAIQFKRGFTAELYKFKRTFLMWMIFLAPAFVPAIMFFVFFSKGTRLVPEGQNAWLFLMQFSTSSLNLLFPMFVIMVALFVNNIEHQSNTWKLIYAQPLNRAVIFLAKAKVFAILLFVSLMIYATLLIIVGESLNILKPEIGFGQPFSAGIIYGIAFKIYLSSLAMAAIQFWLSQRFKNLLVPLGIGIAGLISFMILVQGWEYVIYHPYGFHIMGIGDYKQANYSVWADLSSVYKSLIIAVAVFGLAAIDNYKKRIY